MKKEYVEVLAEFGVDGKLTPKSIRWIDGTMYDIDRVLEVKQCASLKVGGFGTRYKVRIRGEETYIFYEFDKWFVERK